MSLTLKPWRQRNEPVRSRRPTDIDVLWSRLFDVPLGLGELTHLPEALRRGSVPPLNLAETEKDYTLTLDLPGLDEDDFDIQLMGNHLVVSGERRWKDETNEKDFVRVESQYGSFTRTVELPEGFKTDPGRVQATYKKGVLRIVVPKSEPTPAAKIKVKNS